LQILQGYIIRILQHFATKLWNIANFVMLFQTVIKILSRLVEFKILINIGLVHCDTTFLTMFIQTPTVCSTFPVGGNITGEKTHGFWQRVDQTHDQ
jgi:hypothetical protein